MSDTGIFLSLGLLSLLKAICHKTVNQEEHISRKITIFDATLCDGEQSPGASMNTEEKLFIARQLVAHERGRYRGGLSHLESW